MRSGASSLNPHAASYIPLAQRGTSDENKDKLAAEDSKCGNVAAWLGLHHGNTMQNQLQSKGFQNYPAHGTETFPMADDSTLKAPTFLDYYGSSSQPWSESAEKQIQDEDCDMDLAYLQVTFPGVSDESLYDVYLANNGDLAATIDMLSQLEEMNCSVLQRCTADSSEDLPDNSNNGDVSEPGSSSMAAYLKLKKVAGDVGGSSSGSSGQVVPTQPLSD